VEALRRFLVLCLLTLAWILALGVVVPMDVDVCVVIVDHNNLSTARQLLLGSLKLRLRKLVHRLALLVLPHRVLL